MTTARSYQIDLNATSYYHCISRCVRRSFLCGYDHLTQKDFSHRRQWILDRIKFLSTIFYIDICAYAIMSNHYHLVFHVDVIRSRQAKLEDLLCRWELLFPENAKKLKNLIKVNQNFNTVLKDKITNELHSRLTDISWFMRCLNEIIAKMANKEDNCKGRFWEGRFKSQALLDDGALLCAMAYVDLNPIRAGLTNLPELSDFTSIQERLRKYHKTSQNQPVGLMPFLTKNLGKSQQNSTIDFSLEDYFTLVDTTGRIIKDDKKGAIPEFLTPILDRLELTDDGWLKMISNIERNFHYAIGNVTYLKEFIPSLFHRRSKCIDFVEECYKSVASF